MLLKGSTPKTEFRFKKIVFSVRDVDDSELLNKLLNVPSLEADITRPDVVISPSEYFGIYIVSR